MKKKGKYLGDMLVKKGLITEDQLQEAIEEQLRNKKFIGEIFIEKGIVDEDDLFRTIAEQFDIQYVALKDQEIDWDVTTSFSASVITKHNCLVLRADKEKVVMATVNPLDVWALDAVEKDAAPRKVQIVLVNQTDMDAAVKEYHKYSVRKMLSKWRKD